MNPLRQRESRLFLDGKSVFRIAAAVRAYRPGREQRGFTAHANLTGEGITLFFEAPVTRYFHFFFHPFKKTII